MQMPEKNNHELPWIVRGRQGLHLKSEPLEPTGVVPMAQIRGESGLAAERDHPTQRRCSIHIARQLDERVICAAIELQTPVQARSGLSHCGNALVPPMKLEHGIADTDERSIRQDPLLPAGTAGNPQNTTGIRAERVDPFKSPQSVIQSKDDPPTKTPAEFGKVSHRLSALQVDEPASVSSPLNIPSFLLPSDCFE
jgi:hypothetical protein